jgi:uncharacterized protein
LRADDWTYTRALVDGYLQQIVYTIMSDFDPVKEASNLSKHGISLARWIDIDMKITFVDRRRDYGEIRYRGYGYIDGLAYCLVFTERNGLVRPISLRRAHNKEMRRHVP